MRQLFLLLRGPYNCYNSLYIIKNHIHSDLKSEYVMNQEPNTLCDALQIRNKQQKVVILSEANHGWTHLRLQDYKSIEDYNHIVYTFLRNYYILLL
jgi:hypothetical protein